METPNKTGRIGSQRLLQRAISSDPDLLADAFRKFGAIDESETVTWTSPLEEDGFKEYRDTAALKKLGVIDLITYPLKDFWPQRGPVWDATGITTNGTPVLLEAKAHIPEAASPATKASPKSYQLIEESLNKARKFYCPKSTSPWTGTFYQYANRLAHLYYLRELNKIPSILIFLNIINATEMDGPASELEWKGATRLIHAVLGLPAELEKHSVYHVYLDAALLSNNV